MAQFVRAPASKAGDPFSNPGPRENFSLRLTTIRAVKRKKKQLFVISLQMNKRVYIEFSKQLHQQIHE